MLLRRTARFWMREFDPTWSLDETIARVVGVHDETPTARTFLLRPNGHWRGHTSGQFVTVTLEVDGVRERRCYSLSSAPGGAFIAITVQRVRGGKVSNWMHDHLTVGDTLTLSEAQGAFTLPTPRPHAPLFVAAGSGITPILAMLTELDRRRALNGATALVYARAAESVIAGDRLQAIAARNPGLQLHVLLDDRAGGPGFRGDEFERLVPDFAERDTWLCGPSGLMERVSETFAQADVLARLHVEHFTAAGTTTGTTATGVHDEDALAAQPVQVQLRRSNTTVDAHTNAPLLHQLEAAGRRPAHGCRMGICNTCRCRKLSGVVVDSRTGQHSGDGEEDIRICVSVPSTDVTLDL